jgi:hypothetical protein
MTTGKVIPAKHWKHKGPGSSTASIYGAVPWTGAKGNCKEDWEMVEDGFTIAWPDGTVGIGRPPFANRDAAQKWVDEHPRFPGMSQG